MMQAPDGDGKVREGTEVTVTAGAGTRADFELAQVYVNGTAITANAVSGYTTPEAVTVQGRSAHSSTMALPAALPDLPSGSST